MTEHELPPNSGRARVQALGDAILRLGPHEACELLTPEPDARIASVLSSQNPSIADEILWTFPEGRRQQILAGSRLDSNPIVEVRQVGRHVGVRTRK
jgi:hypothetical protein